MATLGNSTFSFILTKMEKSYILLLVYCLFLVIDGTLLPPSTTEEFNKFIIRHDKNYKPGSTEYAKRLKIFEENLKRAQYRNITHHDNSAYYGITKFSDLTDVEFKDLLKLKPEHDTFGSGRPLLFKPRYDGPWRKRPELKDIPKRVDWREKNVISPIRDQERCGACWAFSDVETIEAMYAKKTGQLRRLSVEQFIDCAALGNYGCSGGDTCRALLWMLDNNVTLYDESKYPLTLDDGWCRLYPWDTPGVKLESFTCQSYVGSEDEMLHLLANHGPLVVTVDASTWNDYLGGIIMYHCQNYHNHAVQIIGYDITGPVPYYIIKNSWGEDFGDRGYLYIKVGENLCGLSDRVSTVDV